MSRYWDLVILLLPKASFICKFPLFITPATYPPGVGCLSSVSPCPVSAGASFRFYLGNSWEGCKSTETATGRVQARLEQEIFRA